jgi:hypothetical protein
VQRCRPLLRSDQACAILVAFLAGWPLAACGAGPASDHANADELPSLTAAEDVRIGSVDDPNVGFSRVGPIDVDRDGNVYAFELMESEIRVFDSAGRPIRRFGGPGEGPGEFSMLRSFGVRGDTVWVLDQGLRRLTLFDRTGRVVGTAAMPMILVQLQEDGRSGMVRPRAMRADRRFTSDMTGYTFRRDAPPSGIGAGDTVRVPIVEFDLIAGTADTIAWDHYPPPAERASGGTERIEAGPTSYGVPGPPSDEPLTVHLDDGRFVVDRTRASAGTAPTFVVTRLGRRGDTLYTRTFTYQPNRYTDAALDSLVARSARIPGGAYNPRTGPDPTPEGVDIEDVKRRIRAAMDFPEFQPPIAAAVAGDDGALWLRREDDGGATYRWLILRPDGSPRGVLTLPRGLLVRWSSGDTFWAVENDDLDVPWLVRYRVTDGD